MDKLEYKRKSRAIQQQIDAMRNLEETAKKKESEYRKQKENIELEYIASQRKALCGNVYIKEQSGKKKMYFVLDVFRGCGYRFGYPSVDTRFIEVVGMDGKIISVTENTFGTNMWLEDSRNGKRLQDIRVIRCNPELFAIITQALTAYMQDLKRPLKRKQRR